MGRLHSAPASSWGYERTHLHPQKVGIVVYPLPASRDGDMVVTMHLALPRIHDVQGVVDSAGFFSAKRNCPGLAVASAWDTWHRVLYFPLLLPTSLTLSLLPSLPSAAAPVEDTQWRYEEVLAQEFGPPSLWV